MSVKHMPFNRKDIIRIIFNGCYLVTSFKVIGSTSFAKIKKFGRKRGAKKKIFIHWRNDLHKGYETWEWNSILLLKDEIIINTSIYIREWSYEILTSYELHWWNNIIDEFVDYIMELF